MSEVGKFIVIEGIDGVGKGTQSDLLVSRILNSKRATEKYSFPRYGHPACADVEAYLNGDFGPSDEIDPYQASRYYAADRLAAAPEILANLENGRIVISDRYVDSNAGHQGGKITDAKEREIYLRWLYELEYDEHGIPKPDLVIILYADADIGQRLVGKKDRRKYLREGTHDGHEGDLGHMMRASDAFLYLAHREPERYALINCSPNGEMLSIEEIHEMVWEHAKGLLGD